MLNARAFAIFGLNALVLQSVCAWSQKPKFPHDGMGQLGREVEWIPLSSTQDQFLMAQGTDDGTLFLTPNESFFPRLGLVASGESTNKDVGELNKGSSFRTIEKWDLGDVARWGIFAKSKGELRAKVWMQSESGSGEFTLQLGSSSKRFKLSRTGVKTALVADLVFQVTSIGPHQIDLICQASDPGARFCWIELSGGPVEDGSVLRKRWRPAAAHTKFSSSKVERPIVMWVMEMDAVPGELDFYSPITTPFGYFGPTWKSEGIVNSKLNFSLWSFGRGKEAPPVQQWSHLLAIGNPKANFGGFDHEGTGVKVRDWDPLAQRQGQSQAFAVRVEPGDPYDTYFSYFYANDEKRWRLFGVGNKYNRGKPLKSLWVGSFVEVPGRSSVQRTGSTPRTMRYRGWVMDNRNQLHALDRMTNGNVNKSTGLTHTRRGVTKEGWFYLQTGGWNFETGSKSPFFQLPHPTPPTEVDYLAPDDLKSLLSVPAEIRIDNVEKTATGFRVGYSIRGDVDGAKVLLFYGKEEALTFADRWDQSIQVSGFQQGTNSLNVDTVTMDQPIYLRMLLTNSEGQFFNRQTVQLKD